MQKVESVWDYPRPPRLEPFLGHIRVVHHNEIILDSNRALRLLETSHPPNYYIPLEDLKGEYFKKNDHTTFCEFKGKASYMNLSVAGTIVKNVGWYYEDPRKKYGLLKQHISLYASKLDKCYVNDELVEAQEGDFYGGWITKNIKGPFKGGEGTFGW